MKNNKLKKPLFGGIAGFVSTTLIYPFDTFRSILQNNIHKNRSDIIKQLKPLSLYNGYLFNLSYVIPEKALKIGVNDLLLKMNEDKFNHKITNQIVSGMSAGFIQSFITSPAEMIKIRKQIGNYNSYTQVIKSCGNIYRGLHLTMARDIPFTGIFFPLYYTLRDNISMRSGFKKDIVSGLGAGIVATYVATPFDVIKTKYQKSDDINLKKLIVELKKGGYTKMFRGLIPRIICISSLYSITMAVFEYQKNLFL